MSEYYKYQKKNALKFTIFQKNKNNHQRGEVDKGQESDIIANKSIMRGVDCTLW